MYSKKKKTEWEMTCLTLGINYVKFTLKVFLEVMKMKSGSQEVRKRL